MKKDSKEKKDFLAKLMEVGKLMAEKSKDPKVAKEIKEKANY